jgi:hypothetical protein
MECKKDKINRLYDNELAGTDKTAVEEHLLSCTSCKSYFDGLTGLDTKIRNTVPATAPAGLTTRVMSSLPEINDHHIGFMFNWRLITVAACIVLVLTPAVYFGINRFVKRDIVVTFELRLDDAQTVSLVGDFNGWDVDANKLVCTDGDVWKTTARFKRGRYQYAIIVNNRKWYPDPQEEYEFKKNTSIKVVNNELIKT